MNTVLKLSLVTFLLTPNVRAGSTMSNPALLNLLGTIALVNRTMEEASLNPMDKRRRRNVQFAVSLLPGAIAALAMEYKAVNLPPREFPMVQAMLGGFVDVNAPDKFKAFFKRPDPNLIPKVGTNFPQATLRDVKSGPLWQKMERESQTASVGPVTPVAESISSQEIAQPRGKSSFGYDETRSKNGEAAAIRQKPSPDRVGSLVQDLQKVEEKVNSSKREPPRKNPYRLKLTPKFWNLKPIAELGFLDFEALAQGDEEEKKLGSQIAEILMGVAAIIAALAPMVIAGIQASADVEITRINAATTLATANMQSQTSKYLADTQKDVALKQSEISQQISKQNNDGQTQRLNLQLAELRTAREAAQAAEEEKRRIEMSYNDERIALAKKQAEDNYRLAKETLNANLTQAGLTSGVVSRNSANSLSFSKPGLARSTTTDSPNETAATEPVPKDGKGARRISLQDRLLAFAQDADDEDEILPSKSLRRPHRRVRLLTRSRQIFGWDSP